MSVGRFWQKVREFRRSTRWMLGLGVKTEAVMMEVGSKKRAIVKGEKARWNQSYWQDGGLIRINCSCFASLHIGNESWSILIEPLPNRS